LSAARAKKYSANGTKATAIEIMETQKQQPGAQATG